MTIKIEEDLQGFVVCDANRRIIIRGSTNQGQFFQFIYFYFIAQLAIK